MILLPIIGFLAALLLIIPRLLKPFAEYELFGTALTLQRITGLVLAILCIISLIQLA